MARVEAENIDPVTNPPFKIWKEDRVATAGSCFAQHISRKLADLGFNYYVTERPKENEINAQNYGVFPARFGNIYTARQLLQLFLRAYAVLTPAENAWRTRDDRYVDPFRPQILDTGFDSLSELVNDGEIHLSAVRQMFENCNVFVFTLGLTEAWRSKKDGCVVPFAPGVVSSESSDGYEFCNFSATEVIDDLNNFLSLFRRINPDCRILLTVSPVPLIATFEDRHVLVSTIYSKSVLRVAADAVASENRMVAYFPSYEIITGPHAGSKNFENDKRQVRPEAVSHVMSIFAKHYLSAESQAIEAGHSALPQTSKAILEELEADSRQLSDVICDEEVLNR